MHFHLFYILEGVSKFWNFEIRISLWWFLIFFWKKWLHEKRNRRYEKRKRRWREFEKLTGVDDAGTIVLLLSPTDALMAKVDDNWLTGLKAVLIISFVGLPTGRNTVGRTTLLILVLIIGCANGCIAIALNIVLAGKDGGKYVGRVFGKICAGAFIF